MENLAFEFGGRNVGGQGNYVILEAEGTGHYVGCNLNFDNLRTDESVVSPRWPSPSASCTPSGLVLHFDFIRSVAILLAHKR